MKNRFVVSGCLMIALTRSLVADSGTWMATAGGDWSNTANWNGGIVASNSGYTAAFNAGVGTINNDLSELTLAGLQFLGGAYTLSGNAVTLDAPGSISVAGTQTVATALSLSGTTTVSVASAQALIASGAISGNGGLQLYGGRTVLSHANAYAGPTVLVTGTLEVASVDALGTSSADPANLVIGEGTFRYTGPSATLNRGYTIYPGPASNRAAVIDIPDADTTLTIAGNVAAPGGAFIKTGDGTVVYTASGNQVFSKSRLPNQETGIFSYDENGVAATNAYAAFTVEKGRMVIGAPGQTNTIYAGSGWVGCKTLASPRLDIVGGVTHFTGGWFTVGRGTGTAASPQSPSLHISDAVVYLDGNGICLDNANGQANHRCRPIWTISNSLVQASQNFLLGEDSYCTGRVDVGANSTLICNQQTDHRYGMQVAQAYGPSVDMAVTFDGASTNSTYLLRVNQGGRLTYKGNSTLFLDHTQTQVVMSTSLQSGQVYFDGATLRQRTPARLADWLINHTNLIVGANGLTINTEGRAWLDNALLPDAASPGGSVTKVGAGTLALGAPLQVPLTVSQGSIALASNYSYTNVPAMPSYTFAADTTAEVSGVNALLGYTLASASGLPILNLKPNTFVHATERWAYNGSAMRRRDGLILLTRDLSGEIGSVFLSRKRTISSAWTTEFTWQLYSASTTPADGFALVFQNDPRGTAALSKSSSASLGYTGTAGISNSVALGFDVYNKYLRLGTNGVWLTSAISSIPDIRYTPARISVAYDGAGTLSVRVDTHGSVDTYTVPIDLAATLGATEAYVGLTASTGSGSQPGMHAFSSFTFDADTPAHTAVRLGGAAVLTSGQTLLANLNPTDRQNGFILGSLAYDSDSALNVSTDPNRPAPLTERSLWKINGTAHWKAEGAIATSTNAVNQGPGSAFTVNRYPITGSWTARFHYDIGLSNLTTPADYFCFILQNESDGSSSLSSTPASGLALQWRYYDGTIHSTRLKVSTNGTTTVITDDIAPVTITNHVPVDFTIVYDDTAHAVTMTAVQAGTGTNTTVIPNINLPVIMKNASGAYIGFLGVTGGSYAENVISDFSFVRANGTGLMSTPTPYLAFDSITGSGSLVKRGNAALGLVGDIDRATSNLSVRLEEGGLVLRKASLEPIDQNAGARSDWVFSSQAAWSDDNSLMPCPGKQNAYGTVTTTRRVRIADAWTSTFTFLFGASHPTSWPADAFCLFFHNDPRGPGYANGNVSNAGFTGMQNSFGLRWYFYPGNTSAASNAMTIGSNGTWNEGLNQKYLPVVLKDGPANFTVHYDPAAATITSIITQGSLCATNTFTGVNISNTVGSAYAYLGFGGGTGGAYWDMFVRDFKLTYDSTPADATADQNYLASLVLPDASTNTVTLDSSISSGTYKIAAATVGAGAGFSLNAVSLAGTLSIHTVTQSGDAQYTVASGNTLVLNNVVGGAALSKTGPGTLTLTGSAANYTDSTILSAGTLSLGAALLPSSTVLYVTTGSTLNLAFAGKQAVHSLYVDGVQMHGGRYTASNTTWITGDGVLVVAYPPVGTFFFLN